MHFSKNLKYNKLTENVRNCFNFYSINLKLAFDKMFIQTQTERIIIVVKALTS